MILQRYTFGSKSQHQPFAKQVHDMLLMILQRYTFGSKSQQECKTLKYQLRCL